MQQYFSLAVILSLLLLGASCRIDKDIIKQEANQLLKHNPISSFYNKDDSSQTLAIKKSEELYQALKNSNFDFTKGPCISNEIIPDWVTDIVHDPRQAMDDFPEIQCSAFKEGRVHHFIELDINGKFIKAF